MARRWRSLAYRDPPRSVAVGRLEQVEHEALATLLAAQAGVRVPEVVTAALGPDGDALVVTDQPEVEPLESVPTEQVGDDTLREPVGAGRASPFVADLARKAEREQRARPRRRADACRPLGGDARRPAVGARHRRGRAARRVHHPGRPRACSTQGGRRGLGRRRRSRASVPAARCANSAPPRPRALARGRSQGSPRRGRRRDRSRGAQGCAASPYPPQGPLADGGAGLRRLPADHAARPDRFRHDRRRGGQGRSSMGRRRARPRPVAPSSRREYRCAARC